MFKILLADDHLLVREGMKKLITQHLGGCVIVEAENGNAALAEFDKRVWDIIILDLGLPGRPGLEVLREMRERKPDVRVLVLSALAENELGQRVLKLGAAGFLAKDTNADELLKAIRKVLAGGRYVSSKLADHLLMKVTREASVPHDALSEREYVVFRLIGAGSSVTEIARHLFLSPKTITTYRAQILRKMNMKSNAELIRYALKFGVVE